jgi:hypothetical protein
MMLSFLLHQHINKQKVNHESPAIKNDHIYLGLYYYFLKVKSIPIPKRKRKRPKADILTMSLILGPHPKVEPKKDAVLIKEVRAFIFDNDEQEKESGGGADCHKQAKGHWIVDSSIANPMSVYEQYRASRTSWGIDAMGSIVVEVELTNGIIGVGISIGGDAACFMVEKHFSRFVEGQDPNNVELIWDQCYRASLNYGRKGTSSICLFVVSVMCPCARIGVF